MWGSSDDREALTQFAAAIADLTPFRVCVIEVLRADRMLEVVAVHGDPEAAERLVGRARPHDAVAAIARVGARYGAFTFVARDWRTPQSDALLERHHPRSVDEVAGPDAWRVGDVLVAELRDEDDRLRAVVHLDEPQDGRRPQAEMLLTLSDCLQLAFRAVVNAVEREELLQRVRFAELTRKLIRQASNAMGLQELLALAQTTLREGFGATDFQVHLRESGTYDVIPDEMRGGHFLFEALERMVEQAWRDDTVIVFEPGQVWEDDVLAADHVRVIEELLDASKIGTCVLVPVSGAGRLLGTLVIVRSFDTRRWTASESVAALDVGRDLGRAVLNARAHDREQELSEELVRLDDYRSQLIATMSHELRNPIGVILGHLELLEGFPDIPRDWARSLVAIGKGAHRLDRLSEDLLTFSRLGNPAHPLVRERLDLIEVVEEAVEMEQLAAERRGVKVEVEMDERPLAIEGDRSEMVRMVTNVLSNAIKYSDMGDRVVLRLGRDGECVVLSCTDEGIGISQADQAMLFEEFFRSTNPDAFQRPGTGLGLPILRRIAQRHGGRVSVDSQLGVGTEVRLFLPPADS
ncbi:sensor histidine kinase [Nocardioides jishulii]|uniref:histidine kinase n=1 Tax=Nocardioides jishulii TaxID=2575440 RepID=A0A4U2YRU4_9ACTN|nr:HAMP domain-containing sensor histidine kinase [Nocardioides jishulii]QCX28887.1 HAMP domain-containing histidine kinase [Nocardioides jishulii]TKI64216.1 HAMP domain-containing histidine kinase [Nocardioides jishulii]